MCISGGIYNKDMSWFRELFQEQNELKELHES